MPPPADTQETDLETFQRDDFRCVYCGLDGSTSFGNWLMLDVEHLLPRRHTQRDDPDFRVTACRTCCGSADWYFKQARRDGLKLQALTPEQLIARRRAFVRQAREVYLSFWREHVATAGQATARDKSPITAEMIAALRALSKQDVHQPRRAKEGKDDGIRYFFTPRELAERWEVGSDKVIRWIRAGKLRASDLSERVGMKRPRYRVPLDAVLEFEEGRRVPTPEPPIRRRKPRQPPGYVRYV